MSNQDLSVVSPVELDGWRVNVNTPEEIERAEANLDGQD